MLIRVREYDRCDRTLQDVHHDRLTCVRHVDHPVGPVSTCAQVTLRSGAESVQPNSIRLTYRSLSCVGEAVVSGLGRDLSLSASQPLFDFQ